MNVDIRRLLDQCPGRPSLIVRLETDFPLLPWGLTEVDIPTACFQTDTYAFTQHRVRWSLLFDYTVLFHPGFEDRFRQAGHARPVTLPYAVMRELFQGPERERIFEVGWVGQSHWRIYKSRRRILSELAAHFRINDWRRRYTLEEMADIYCRSKVVVNAARDDYPQDANMRAFEAMGAGALLVTRVPSELPAIGFQEGVHFVGYAKEDEIVPLVRRYLADEAARRRIAQGGREKVLREHTYDCRVQTLLKSVQQDDGRLFAPARQWSEERVRLAYLDFYAAHGCLNQAYDLMRRIARLSLRQTVAGTYWIARAWSRQARDRLVAAVRQFGTAKAPG